MFGCQTDGNLTYFTNAIEGKLMTPLAREVLRQEHSNVINCQFLLKWDAERELVEVGRV